MKCGSYRSKQFVVVVSSWLGGYKGDWIIKPVLLAFVMVSVINGGWWKWVVVIGGGVQHY